MATSSSSTLQPDSSNHADPIIPPQLKFFMSNIKTIITTQLTPENHPIWKSQILKLFKANGFEGYLTGEKPSPPSHLTLPTSQNIPNPAYQTWNLVDQHLAAALTSTISAPLLPYVLNLETCTEIWLTVERRLQSNNRSKLLQLKGELHHLTMQGKTMTQYLADIKAKIDAIAAAGSTIPPEDIILHILQGLPPTYQSFKTAIRTNLQPLHIDDFYALLCSEETNLAMESVHITPPDHLAAVATSRGRGRGRFSSSRGRFSPSSRGRSSPTTNFN